MIETAAKEGNGEKDSRRNWSQEACGNIKQLGQLLLIAAVVTFLARTFYFLIFPWVLSFNLAFRPGELTPWIENWTNERDGIEIYVVYILVFAIIALSALLHWLMVKLWRQGKIAAIRAVWVRAGVLGGILCGYNLLKRPPMEVTDDSVGIVGLLVVPVLLFLVYGLGQWSRKGMSILAFAVLLLPACFTIVSGFSAGNYAYIFSPAQKMLDGVRVQEIYFQYDFMLSALVALWMKAGMALDHFQYVGSASIYFAILAVFFIGYRHFESYHLAFAMALCILTFRVLANVVDPVFVFQVTPLRLDMWIVLVLAITFKKATGLLVPLMCGSLIIIQSNFGIIYTIGYLQVILTLAAIDMLDAGWRQKLREWSRPCILVRCAMVGAYLVCSLLLSRYLFGASQIMTGYYQTIGIGFLPMPRLSLFWLLPVILSAMWTALFLIRHQVSRAYLSLGYAALYFFIGNCIYFFGRSHEQNLFNIGISLIFVIFYAVDIFSRFIGSFTCQRGFSGAVGATTGISILVGIALSNLTVIERNLFTKGAILSGHLPKYGGTFADLQSSIDVILDRLDHALGPDARVQFLTIEDAREFMFYQNDRQSLSFAYPYAATIFTSTLIKDTRDMLDAGYYLLMDRAVFSAAHAAGLSREDYAYATILGEYHLIGKWAPSLR